MNLCNPEMVSQKWLANTIDGHGTTIIAINTYLGRLGRANVDFNLGGVWEP